MNIQYQIPISKLQKPNKFQISKEEKFQTNKKQSKNMPCGIDPPSQRSYGATSYEQIQIRFCW
jgi:hypothetical protein